MLATAANLPIQHSELFLSMAQDIAKQGYSIQNNALPLDLSNQLFEQISLNNADSAKNNADDFFERTSNKSAAGNKTQSIQGINRAEKNWMNWSHEIMTCINQQRPIQLETFNSHFSHYPSGTHCSEHLDATEKTADREVTLIAFLNPGWEYGHGGHLVIRDAKQKDKAICIQPLFRTVVAFLSKEFPHAVLPTWRDRYSITGWFN